LRKGDGNRTLKKVNAAMNFEYGAEVDYATEFERIEHSFRTGDPQKPKNPLKINGLLGGPEHTRSQTA
jgi:hypothetical protein